MAVALDDLGREHGGFEGELFANGFLDARIEVGVGADGAADFADADTLAHFAEALERAGEFVIHQRHLQAETDRLRVDAVAAADHRGEFVLLRADGHRLAQGEEIGFEQIAGLEHLDGDGRVEQVGRGETLVNPARGGADILGDILEERDDIVVRAFFDLADFFDVESSLGADFGGVGFRDRAEFGHRLTGEGFDLEPDFEFALLGPNGPHFRQGIAFDH